MVMKDSTTSGAEIDLEITEYDKGGGSKQPNYQMQLPIWKPSNGQGDATKLAKDGSELQETLHNGFYEDKGKLCLVEAVKRSYPWTPIVRKHSTDISDVILFL